jgi:hypothetical protein
VSRFTRRDNRTVAGKHKHDSAYQNTISRGYGVSPHGSCQYQARGDANQCGQSAVAECSKCGKRVCSYHSYNTIVPSTPSSPGYTVVFCPDCLTQPD